MHQAPLIGRELEDPKSAKIKYVKCFCRLFKEFQRGCIAPLPKLEKPSRASKTAPALVMKLGVAPVTV